MLIQSTNVFPNLSDTEQNSGDICISKNPLGINQSWNHNVFLTNTSHTLQCLF